VAIESAAQPDAAPVITREGHYVEGRQTYATLDEQISSVVFKNSRHPRAWYLVLLIGFIGANVLMVSLAWLLYKGVGVWGINIPVGWGIDILNFVWWIGIGHAGTLISAILLLLRQQWRNSINRFAEAMTLFAVMCAGLYPLFHTGRPWVAFYWLAPIGPNILGLWPQFRSPLIWDVFAVSTYLTVSLLFWLVGLIPDFAIMRDRAQRPALKRLFGVLALGWRGSTRHWQRYETAYLILAGLSAPLVLSVHSIVSLDFAVGIVPGWHTTIFPPYFVAGAVFAGFAMVLLFAIPVRHWYKLKDFITDKHIDWCARIMLVMGLMVAYGYFCEAFYGFYSGGRDQEMIINRATGPYAWSYWLLILCNCVIPQTMWVDKWRRNELVLALVALDVSLGMWLERFVIIIVSLQHAEQPTMRDMYYPTVWDWGFFIGTMGFFTFMMFLFIRFVPMINIFEMKDLLHKQKHDEGHLPSTATGPIVEAAPAAISGE
jgi:Ni/Fe-hydrogenase subunit HybB-like protein